MVNRINQAEIPDIREEIGLHGGQCFQSKFF
jgi:hypothetical protein